jgi:hypothetical protein
LREREKEVRETVRGAVGECGEKDYPGIFVRVDHPSI